jgi:hypothetical protein
LKSLLKIRELSCIGVSAIREKKKNQERWYFFEWIMLGDTGLERSEEIKANQMQPRQS